jgi:6-phosphofructokinase
MPHGKVLVAQGGGPTAVINQSMAGVVLEARKFRNVELVYGAYHGVRGIINEEFLDLTQETSHNIEMVARTPSSALGSTRDKPDLKYCQEIFKVLKAHGIGYFLLHRRQRFLGYRAHRQRRGTPRRIPAALHPHSEDHRQRPGR